MLVAEPSLKGTSLANRFDFSQFLMDQGALLPFLGFNSEKASNLAFFLNRLWEANQSLNLFSRKMSPQSLVEDHLLDCMVALPFLPSAEKAADLGSGGGLPAIPIALARPEMKLVLFEKSPKKRQFLGSLRDLCPNIEVRGLIEPQTFEEHFDWITCRAFKPIPVILELTRPHALRGGAYYLYKGRKDRIDQELAEAKLGGLESTIQSLPIHGSADERHLVILKSN